MPHKNSGKRQGNDPKPTKMCVVCGRPFEWRKKWAKVWDAVKYCSERCRRAAH
ncbi:MAG: DUF2256 domain-containing protein [Chloroflexi bacterium CFX4]|nr:DUF2256 domain-containing protein [Chloroflexi bacterium CFX4]MDL1921859.1 DUF2256 domain-containing protein [Chloroflexi bacterium CFX3]